VIDCFDKKSRAACTPVGVYSSPTASFQQKEKVEEEEEEEEEVDIEVQKKCTSP